MPSTGEYPRPRFSAQLALQSLFYLGVYWQIYYYERQEPAQLTLSHMIEALHWYLNQHGAGLRQFSDRWPRLS